jgi:hypothetical protein
LIDFLCADVGDEEQQTIGRADDAVGDELELRSHCGFLHGVWIIGSKEIAPFQTFSCLHSPAKTRFRMAGE